MSSAGHRANTERHSHIHIFKKSQNKQTQKPHSNTACALMITIAMKTSSFYFFKGVITLKILVSHKR